MNNTISLFWYKVQSASMVLTIRVFCQPLINIRIMLLLFYLFINHFNTAIIYFPPNHSFYLECNSHNLRINDAKLFVLPTQMSHCSGVIWTLMGC